MLGSEGGGMLMPDSAISLEPFSFGRYTLVPRRVDFEAPDEKW